MSRFRVKKMYCFTSRKHLFYVHLFLFVFFGLLVLTCSRSLATVKKHNLSSHDKANAILAKSRFYMKASNEMKYVTHIFHLVTCFVSRDVSHIM